MSVVNKGGYLIKNNYEQVKLLLFLSPLIQPLPFHLLCVFYIDANLIFLPIQIEKEHNEHNIYTPIGIYVRMWKLQMISGFE